MAVMTAAVAILPALAHCGWRVALPAASFDATQSGRVARVIAQHRSGYRVTDGEREFAAQAPAAWTRKGLSAEQRAAVGDWVLLAGNDDRIQCVLTRSSLLRRGAAGEHYAAQLIAANIDTVLIVCGLDHDFNPRRIDRYLLIVQDSGAQPVLVLTKVDRFGDLSAPLAALSNLRTGVPVLTVNAKDPESVAQLHPWLGKGSSLVLVGSSGAGKSTLTNTLLGTPAQRTSEVRLEDSRGRHTTTHRALLRLPGGACLIDTPGMREIKLTGAEVLSDGGFEDIAALASGCRFRDCGHAGEPGCAIEVALASGALDSDRWTNFRKLKAELSVAADRQTAQRERKSNEKSAGRAFNRRLAEKYGHR